MKFQDLENLYLEAKKEFGIVAYKHISNVLSKAKKIHKQDWLKNPTPNKDH